MSKLDEIEAALAASWDREQLAVYGDYLEANGDPRGELISIDLHVERHGPSEQLGARKRAVIDNWLGAELAARVLEIGAVTYGFVELRSLAAEELERVLGVGAIASALRAVAIEDHDPGLRRAIDTISSLRPPWLERCQVARYPDAFDAELRPSIAIDDERARAFVVATPRLRALTVAGTNAFGELVHPRIRELRVYDYDAITSLLSDGAPFAALTDLDMQLSPEPRDVDLAALLPEQRFPALRRLDLSRNERNSAHVFELIKRHPLVPQLAWLRVPSLRDDADVDAVELAIARMRDNAELVVARAYPDSITRAPSLRITMPSPRPWPRGRLRGSLAVALAGEPVREALRLSSIIIVLERAFDGLAEPSRAVWVELWRRIAELSKPRPGDEPPPAFQFSGAAFALALEPLDLSSESAWAELRTALRARSSDVLEIRRVI